MVDVLVLLGLLLVLMVLDLFALRFGADSRPLLAFEAPCAGAAGTIGRTSTSGA